MTTARELVTRRVARRARQFPQLEIGPLDTDELAQPRDAALATAIDHAVARRWLTLETVLRRLLSRPWGTIEEELRAALLVGAAQLLLLDRVPDHAVINDAVTIAKKRVRAGAGGLVNAVLRRVAALRVEVVPVHDPARQDELPLADGRAWRLAEPVFDDDPWQRLAQQTSHPAALLDAWRATLGDEAAARVAAHGLVHAPIIVTGLTGATPDVTAHAEDGFHVYDGPRAGLDALLAAHPGARVQDPASAAPVAGAADLEPRLVVDVCAGLGTKTRQLARQYPGARVIAADVDARRAAILRETFAGDGTVEVVPFEDLGVFRGQADLLVVDAPCSNTGVLARRVEARYRFGPETTRSLVDCQRQVVADAIPLLGDAGHLLYATCCLQTEENEDLAAWVRRWHRLHEVRSARRLPTGQPGEAAAAYADGGFFSLLQRT